MEKIWGEVRRGILVIVSTEGVGKGGKNQSYKREKVRDAPISLALAMGKGGGRSSALERKKGNYQ